MLNIPLSGIKKIESIVLDDNSTVSLSQGALKVGGIPKEIKEYLSNVLKTDKTDYYQSAWGIMPLREKLSEKVLEQENVKIDPSQFLVTHGCIGALSTLFLTLLEPGDEVILPEPTYPAYEKLTKLARAKTVFVSMESSDSEEQKSQEALNIKDTSITGSSFDTICKQITQDERVKPGMTNCEPEIANIQWDLSIKKIKQAKTDKTKIIVFSNPWNPLGIIIDQKKINELLHWCEENKIYLIIDEAYKDYAFDSNYKSTIGLVNKSEYFINVNSFSKNMAMSGWRVGYMAIPKKLVTAAGSMQDALLNCPNVPAQYAALFALDHKEYTDEFHNKIKRNLEITKKLLKPLVDKNIFSYQEPKGSFFIFLKVSKETLGVKTLGVNENDSERLAMSILKHAKVSLVPGKFFGESGKPFLRLCYAREEDVLVEGLKRLNKYFL